MDRCTGSHDITKIILKIVLNTIQPTLPMNGTNLICLYFCLCSCLFLAAIGPFDSIEEIEKNCLLHFKEAVLFIYFISLSTFSLAVIRHETFLCCVGKW